MFTILPLPSPLHPAVVHFPIVLLLLGSVVAVAAAFVRRWQLPGIAAVLFVLGAAGAVTAVQTGGREGEMAGEAPAIESLVDRHEAWAERTQLVALIVAGLAISAAFITRWPVARRTLGVATAVGALVAAWCVVETGHYGGQLVYRHGAGVNLAHAGANDASSDRPAAKTAIRRTHEDD